MERTQIIVAFGDILGFRIWTQRASNTSEVLGDLIQSFYSEMEAFVLKHNDVQIKYLGDGLMILKEFPKKQKVNGYVQEFVHDIVYLTKRLIKIIRPFGLSFRTRMAAGYVWKLDVIDTKDPTRKKKTDEFIGYAINLTRGLLDISPQIPFICHESVHKIIGKQKHGIRFTFIGNSKERRRGIDQEDLAGLWKIEV